MKFTNENYREIEGQVCITTQELCDRLGIARKTLSEWEEKGCPKAMRGWWPLWEMLEWRGLIGSGGVRTEEDVNGMALSQQKLFYETEYKKKQTEKADFEMAIERGEFLKKEDITSELSRFFIVLKRSLLAISRKIANEVGTFVDSTAARRIEKMVTELTMDALGQLSIDGVYNAKKKKTET